MVLTSIVYILRGDEVLLAMKKRGFGAGKWNGPGGKVQPGETPFEAAAREVKEEVELDVADLEHRGTIDFTFAEQAALDFKCHIFVTRSFSGEPRETEEMRPQWYPLSAVPYDDMWEDDRIWLDNVLRGGNVWLKCFFTKDMKFIRHEPIPPMPL